MAKKKKDVLARLSEAESEIMEIVWGEGQPLTSTFILEHLTSRTWALSTVMTALARLCEKGYLQCDRSTRTNLYSALISNEEYLEQESSEFLRKMHQNSIASMVTALNNSGAISEDEIAKLREILDGKPEQVKGS
ncbi:MAG: BlaI/MecI/CopY family transcriptional regulator [Coriobacteriia bacterium]|nr:BlaI/MecI/CopY family transcriptional regulator [Coriobacteriia bacterium]